MLESFALLKATRAMKKMASASVVSVVLLCCFAACQGCDQYAETGQSVNVPLGSQLTDTQESLKWKFEGQQIFYRRAKVYIMGTIDDITADGSFILPNVTKHQAGLYTPEIYDRNGRLTQILSSTNLCVLDPVKKPKVKTNCTEATVRFECVSDSQPDGVQYRWFQNGEPISNETKMSLKRKTAETKKVSYSCEVSNGVSSTKSDPVTHTCVSTDPVKKPQINATCTASEVIFTCFSTQQTDDVRYIWLLNGTVISNETNVSLIRKIAESEDNSFSCEVYNDASSEKSGSFTQICVDSTFLGLPKEIMGISIWIFIGGGGGVVLVVIMVVIVCCVRCKRKRKMSQNDEEELQYRAAHRAAHPSSPTYCSP